MHSTSTWVCREPEPVLALGMVVATPGAIECLHRNNMEATELLNRHGAGDWGELSDHDRHANHAAVHSELRVISNFRLADGTSLWVITEADRSVTTLLLPSEY